MLMLKEQNTDSPLEDPGRVTCTWVPINHKSTVSTKKSVHTYRKLTLRDFSPKSDWSIRNLNWAISLFWLTSDCTSLLTAPHSIIKHAWCNSRHNNNNIIIIFNTTNRNHSVVVIIDNNGASLYDGTHRNVLLKAQSPLWRVARPAGTVYDDADPRSRCISPIAPASNRRIKHITINPNQYNKQTQWIVFEINRIIELN